MKRVRAPGTLAVNLLLKGSDGQKAGEIIELLNDYAAGLYFRQDAEVFKVLVSAPSKGISGAVKIANTVLRKPDYPEREVKREIEAAYSDAQERLRQPEMQALISFVNALAEPHPYANALFVVPEHIKATTRADILNWHRQSISTKGASIVVVGNLDASAMAILVDELLRDLPAGEGRKAPVPVISRTPLEKTLRIKAGNDGSQSLIMLGGLKPATQNMLELATQAMLSFLYSDMQNSRLFMDTREKLGTTYGLSGSNTDYRGIGSYTINGRIDRAGVDATVAALLASWKKMRAEGPSDAEIASVRSVYFNYLTQLTREHVNLAEFTRDHLTRIGNIEATAKVFESYFAADLKDVKAREALFVADPFIVIAD